MGYQLLQVAQFHCKHCKKLRSCHCFLAKGTVNCHSGLYQISQTLTSVIIFHLSYSIYLISVDNLKVAIQSELSSRMSIFQETLCTAVAYRSDQYIFFFLLKTKSPELLACPLWSLNQGSNLNNSSIMNPQVIKIEKMH